jgi:hypothetical protein
MEKSLLTECLGFEQTIILECTAYSPTSVEPVWNVQVSDIPPFLRGVIQGDQVYLFGEENSVTGVYIGSLN